MENRLYFETKNVRDITSKLDTEREKIGFYDLPLNDPSAYIEFAEGHNCSEVVVFVLVEVLWVLMRYINL